MTIGRQRARRFSATFAAYRDGMFDVAGTLFDALSAARSRLGASAGATARSGTAYGGSRVDAAMAGVAEQAIFSEAVMSAVHARLAEIKSVTHS
jgi:hypothetical protein